MVIKSKNTILDKFLDKFKVHIPAEHRSTFYGELNYQSGKLFYLIFFGIFVLLPFIPSYLTMHPYPRLAVWLLLSFTPLSALLIALGYTKWFKNHPCILLMIQYSYLSLILVIAAGTSNMHVMSFDSAVVIVLLISVFLPLPFKYKIVNTLGCLGLFFTLAIIMGRDFSVEVNIYYGTLVLLIAVLTIILIYSQNELRHAIWKQHITAEQSIKDIRKWEKMLYMINESATILLQTEPEKFMQGLYKCIELIANAADVDRVYIWKCADVDGVVYATQIHEWSEGAEPQQGNEYTVNIPLDEAMPDWRVKLARGSCVNEIVREMSDGERAQLEPQGILSILILPIYYNDVLWGFVGFDNCHEERLFLEEERSILRASSLLISNAILRNEAIQVRSEILKSSLERIVKSPLLSAGNLYEAARLLAYEAGHALNTHRVGIWSATDESRGLRSVVSYNVLTDDFTVQDDFDLNSRAEYVKFLKSDRLIVISDINMPNPLSETIHEYGPDICAMLDAPIHIGGNFVGVVCIEQDKSEAFPNKREWTIEEQNYAASLADFMALAIEATERLILSRRTETLMSNLPGMVYQCLNDPPNFTFTFASEGSFTLMGYTPDELIGNSTVAFLDLVHPDDKEELERLNELTLSSGLPLDATFRIVMKNGTIKWIWERSRVVEFRPDGTPYLLEGFYTDITEQRRLEAAELANRAKSEFLANMSHEIRTPMNAILGMVDIALRNNPKPKVRDNLNNIKIASGQLLSIINDILDFSKVEAGELELIPEKYQVFSMINDIATMIHVRIDDKPIDFIVDDDPDLPAEIIGDVTRIKQVAINLLTNAVKFTKKGHILFSISAEPVDENSRYKLHFSITDTGMGIREEDIPLLFNNFSQLDTRKNRSVEGTGLGLAISRKIVELMDGEIHVESEYGVGSCFSFYVMQEVLNPKPLTFQPQDDDLRVAVWLSNSVKANIIASKLKKMGINYSLIDSAKNSAGHTHVIFDYENHKLLLEAASPGTKLIALTPGLFDPDKASPDFEVVNMPLTNIAVLRLLNRADIQQDEHSDMMKSSIALHDVRVLIVDDIEINLIIAEETILLYGAEVDTAESATEAIEMIKSTDYDMVLMDHMMPEIDGVDATKMIRKLPGDEYKTLPIIALTANVVGNVQEMFLKSGMNDFLSKPLEYSEIERVFKEWLPPEKWSYLE